MFILFICRFSQTLWNTSCVLHSKTDFRLHLPTSSNCSLSILILIFLLKRDNLSYSIKDNYKFASPARNVSLFNKHNVIKRLNKYSFSMTNLKYISVEEQMQLIDLFTCILFPVIWNWSMFIWNSKLNFQISIEPINLSLSNVLSNIFV